MPPCWKRCQSKYRTYHVHLVNVTSAAKLYNIVLSSLCFQNIFTPLENYATIKHSVHIASKPRSLLTSDFVSVSLSILQFIQEGSYNVFPLCACFSLSTCFLSQLVLQHNLNFIPLNLEVIVTCGHLCYSYFWAIINITMNAGIQVVFKPCLILWALPKPGQE